MNQPICTDRAPLQRLTRVGLAWIVAACSAATAGAQTFNIDVGPDPPNLPPASYGAAAGQAGFWNAYSPVNNAGGTFALLDTNGVATSATIAWTGNTVEGTQMEPVPGDPDHELMSDYALHLASITWTFAGLAPGTYMVYTYGWVADTSSTVTIPGGTPMSAPIFAQPNWPGQQVLNVTYVNQTVAVTDTFTVTTSIATGKSGGINGFQLVPISPPVGSNYCGPAVPNSSGASGVMAASGSASIMANDLVLLASGCPPGQFGFFIYSPNQAFFPAYNGNICINNTIGRFYPAVAIGAGGAASMAVNNTALPTPGAPFIAFTTMNFQFFFRDIMAPPAFANFTDGLAVFLLP